jgi:hypothetical protein
VIAQSRRILGGCARRWTPSLGKSGTAAGHIPIEHLHLANMRAACL